LFFIGSYKSLCNINLCVVKIKICFDIDLSTKFGLIYFGVYRSSLKKLSHLKILLKEVEQNKSIKLNAIMGYEAQMSGVADQNPDQQMMSIPINILKKLAKEKINIKRNEIVNYVKSQGYNLEFINGGGSGSIEYTIQDESVTEVAVGSAFYSPRLFDYYSSFKHKPAAFFALEVTRN